MSKNDSVTDRSLDLIISAIRSVVGDGNIPLHEPVFQGNEWKYLKECLDSTFVSSVGKFVDRFENEIASYTGAKHAVAVVNGTAALHIALKLAGVQAGDEVILPALTFVATANAVSYCDATPHFVDSEQKHLGIDPVKLREHLKFNTEIKGGFCIHKKTERRIRALVAMHTFGHPVQIEELQSLCRDFHLEFIEDAAESLGSFYFGQHTGTFGLFGTLSFNGNKTITTGGGGVILTNDAELAKRAKHITTTAKIPHPWSYEHDEIGYNYRMPNLNAALGCAQLESLPDLLLAKRTLFEKYSNAFSEVKDILIFPEPEGCKSNYWLQALLLSKGNVEFRDSLLEKTNKSGIMTRPVWTLLHKSKPFIHCPKADLEFAEWLEDRLINIPSSSNLCK
ncbi:aminotransferase DegT [Leptospira perolatii]|uniref:GDP-perosamine synthase n=1 Tax=Leptospira perolatii TaxID=2023191 RepID=A0A2M9ZL53_9LEPT|nr:LegC family aminotransferase [Leptospira perolatii]PJZ70296.1 aminotransferase DegT [Leptospira perolatii]PJZ72820.1 aminotransferase DegT [Leptospira perolatii]